MHYYQHHIGDFQRDTSNLTDSQLAAYLRMIWMYYDLESPLPNDHETIAFKIRASVSDVALIAKHYFQLDAEGMLQHSRCNAEIEKFYKKSETARAKAKARWSNTQAKPQQSSSNATASKSDATHIPINTLTNVSDAPTAAAPQNTDSMQAMIFDMGKKLLGEKSGSIIGKARKTVGDQKVLEVIAGMSAANPPLSDPLTYFIAATTPKVRGVVL